jgi:hypothetical protein
VPEPVLFVPLMMAPGVLLLNVWLLKAEASVNALLKPDTLKMALLATTMLAVLVIKPLPLNVSVPALMMVAPL